MISSGQWAVGSGQWAVSSGQWAVGSKGGVACHRKMKSAGSQTCLCATCLGLGFGLGFGFGLGLGLELPLRDRLPQQAALRARVPDELLQRAAAAAAARVALSP